GYNNKPHSSLKRITDPVTFKKRHQSPLEAWNEALEMGAPIDRVEDWDAEDLFRPYEERKVRRGEIELFGNRYFSQDLSEYHGDTVQVGYDIHNADQITVRDEDGRLICYAKWNANKRAYFPQTKVEQARQRRADGRLRRLALKQDEVLQEVNPQKVIEHIEDQSTVIFTPRAERLVHQMAEPILVEQPMRRPTLVQEATAEPVELTAKEKMQRWIALDSNVMAGIEVNDDERSFWTSFQLSRVFKSFKENDVELIEYLAQRQA
ncbi:MAG: Mu transposase C-terminal domain-containing protein, partial [Acinetobacter sp.]|uniref:Mu transposase C-terminal domain-containing protein n=1 Tax=Acinetobacter sp. TaxID=472 RepID=UPI003D00DD39